MLGWLLRFLLALFAARLVVRALRPGRPAPPRFDPEAAANRGKPRAAPPFDPSSVDDADFEELPGE